MFRGNRDHVDCKGTEKNASYEIRHKSEIENHTSNIKQHPCNLSAPSSTVPKTGGGLNFFPKYARTYWLEKYSLLTSPLFLTDPNIPVH